MKKRRQTLHSEVSHKCAELRLLQGELYNLVSRIRPVITEEFHQKVTGHLLEKTRLLVELKVGRHSRPSSGGRLSGGATTTTSAAGGVGC
jgi:hypothetical protein